ncbi:MAG: hypothetical protein WCR52_21780 [Bacteroidota bacterium]
MLKNNHEIPWKRLDWMLILWFATGLGCCTLFGCHRDQEAIVRQKVAERTSIFRAKKTAECREKLFLVAEKMVDSLLLAEAQQQLRDSLSRSRPGRPLKPMSVPPIDSLTVKPLFDR